MYYQDEYEIKREEYAERCFADFISRPIFGDFEEIDDEWRDEDECEY